jgi:hypothetical protein
MEVALHEAGIALQNLNEETFETKTTNFDKILIFDCFVRECRA